MSPNKNISERSRRARQLFLGIKGHLEDEPSKASSLVRLDDIEDALDRFLLWCGNLGALHSSGNKLSLDHRLRVAPEVREQICQFLDDLQGSIQGLIEASGISSLNRESQGLNKDETEFGSEDEESYKVALEYASSFEVQGFLEEISQCIRSLFRLGALIRKAVVRDRFEEALHRSESTFPPTFDLDYVRNKHPKLCRQDMGSLAARVGNANAKRRQYIQYCRDHRNRLGNASDETDGGLNADGGDAKSKATTMLPGQQISIEDDLVSLTTVSTIFDPNNSLKLPALEELSPDSEPFECPICFTLQSFQTEKAWNAHAFRDLKGYVCTVGGAHCENELFDNRDAWFEHELRKHRSEYICPICTIKLDGQASIESHLESGIHGKFSADQVERLAEAGKQTPTHFRAQDCPFCDDWVDGLEQKSRTKNKRNAQPKDTVLVSTSRFKRHIATHQEQIAIFVMPRSNEEEDQSSISDNKSDKLEKPTADIIHEAVKGPLTSTSEEARNIDPSSVSNTNKNRKRDDLGYTSDWRWDCSVGI
ncbi:hypothetical protein F4811DRAFT_549807 [Daldinia bambusicola]|nr:hypothetical protein F4811DRAFT_549807 [Daldinia bambusicola]